MSLHVLHSECISSKGTYRIGGAWYSKVIRRTRTSHHDSTQIYEVGVDESFESTDDWCEWMWRRVSCTMTQAFCLIVLSIIDFGMRGHLHCEWVWRLWLDLRRCHGYLWVLLAFQARLVSATEWCPLNSLVVTLLREFSLSRYMRPNLRNRIWVYPAQIE